jgi:hypothetical protein
MVDVWKVLMGKRPCRPQSPFTTRHTPFNSREDRNEIIPARAGETKAPMVCQNPVVRQKDPEVSVVTCRMQSRDQKNDGARKHLLNSGLGVFHDPKNAPGSDLPQVTPAAHPSTANRANIIYDDPDNCECAEVSEQELHRQMLAFIETL